jgi:hypothetical protein
VPSVRGIDPLSAPSAIAGRFLPNGGRVFLFVHAIVHMQFFRCSDISLQCIIVLVTRYWSPLPSSIISSDQALLGMITLSLKAMFPTRVLARGDYLCQMMYQYELWNMMTVLLKS